MSDVVIRVENLCKEYHLGIISHGTLRRDFQSGWAKFRGKEDPNTKIDLIHNGGVNTNDRFLALNDISFDVKQGEIVGIIGRNGAGKSTLLKIISRVTAPTKGTIKIKGRVASLLEVGTGFHPELTGRENIFLNGAILGMHTCDLEQKFDEIVKFAEIHKFIDTPVKRYSSGMYVRLAFAVAAHLDPEILIVDEVLAVGDLPFQKKCLGKMREVSQEEGRTVIFVSHNMDAIRNLCTRAMLLHEGKVLMDGSTDETIGKYLVDKMGCIGERIWPDVNIAPGDKVVRVHAARVLDQQGNVCKSFDVRDPIVIELEYQVLEEGHHLHVHFSFIKEGYTLFVSKDNLDSPWRDTVYPTGCYRATCHIPGDFLNEGEVSVYLAITTVGMVNVGHASIEELLIFDINDRMDPNGVRGNYPLTWVRQGVRPRLHWHVEKI